MSTSDKPDHARGWLYVEKLLDEEDDRVEDDGAEWSADDLLARAETEAAKRAPRADSATPKAPASPIPEVAPTPPQKVAPVIPIRRPWRTVGLAAAACVALFLLVKLTQGPEIVGQSRPSNLEIAKTDRDHAQTSCARKDWIACKESLDEAAKLDPAGESEPRVQEARKEIAVGLARP